MHLYHYLISQIYSDCKSRTDYFTLVCYNYDYSSFHQIVLLPCLTCISHVSISTSGENPIKKPSIYIVPHRWAILYCLASYHGENHMFRDLFNRYNIRVSMVVWVLTIKMTILLTSPSINNNSIIYLPDITGSWRNFYWILCQ